MPTGALSPLTPSGQWPPVAEAVPNEELDLVLCEGNWKHAEEHPEIVQGLIDKEVEAGFVVRTDLTEATAKLVGRLESPWAASTWFSPRARTLAWWWTARSAM